MKRKKRVWGTLANWLVDVSKYLMTGILLSSVFKDVESKLFLCTISLGLSIGILLLGMFLKSKEE